VIRLPEARQLEKQLDPAALAEIAQLSAAIGRNVFRKLEDNFISDLSGRVDLITAALESSNMSQLALATHPLGGSSAIVGAKQFSDVCRKVEQHARDGDVVQANSFGRELLEAAQILPSALLRAADYR